jgi:hypothetical protein
MSAILDKVNEWAKRGEYHRLSLDEKIQLTAYLLKAVQELEAFLNGTGDAFHYADTVRYGLHALDNLVLNGCPRYVNAEECNGDLAVTGPNALVGRCCKCGQWIADFWG